MVHVCDCAKWNIEIYILLLNILPDKLIALPIIWVNKHLSILLRNSHLSQIDIHWFQLIDISHLIVVRVNQIYAIDIGFSTQHDIFYPINILSDININNKGNNVNKYNK